MASAEENMPTLHRLPAVDRIEGLEFQPAPSPDDALVLLQYTDQTAALCEVTMPMREAMMPLTFLRQMQLEQGYPLPERPIGRT